MPEKVATDVQDRVLWYRECADGGADRRTRNSAHLANNQHSYSPPMKIAVKAMLLAIFMAAVAAPAAVIVGPALLGDVPWWVSPQPRIQATFVPNICDLPRIHYRSNPDYVPPPYCQGTSWYHGPPPSGDAQPPPGPSDSPSPPGDAPPPAPDAPVPAAP
jgi:hypothetical protein